jgi:hypothetical protein
MNEQPKSLVATGAVQEQFSPVVITSATRGIARIGLDRLSDLTNNSWNFKIGHEVRAVGEKMTNLKLGTLGLLAACVLSIGIAGAQSVRHDRMDARSARADIKRLKHIRKNDVRHQNWGKVAQDDRLIAADRHFVHKDVRKVDQSGG